MYTEMSNGFNKSEFVKIRIGESVAVVSVSMLQKAINKALVSGEEINIFGSCENIIKCGACKHHKSSSVSKLMRCSKKTGLAGIICGADYCSKAEV